MLVVLWFFRVLKIYVLLVSKLADVLSKYYKSI